MGLFSGKKVTKGEVAKVTGERKTTLRKGSVGRPLAPSGQVKTARWKYGSKKNQGKK